MVVKKGCMNGGSDTLVIKGSEFCKSTLKYSSKEISVKLDGISSSDRKILSELDKFGKYRNPVFLDDTDLWDELKTLCLRLVSEMRYNAVIVSLLDGSSETKIDRDGVNFIPLSYDRVCFTMMKLRDCIDEIRNRGCVCESISSIWEATEIDELFCSLLSSGCLDVCNDVCCD